jgi:hypothetical protein
VAGIVLDSNVRTSFDKSLDTLQVRVQGSPVQRCVTRVVSVVDESRAQGNVSSGELLKKKAEDF